MEALALVEATKVKTLRPSVFVQVGGKIVICIDKIGVLSRPSLDILVGLVGWGLVIPKLKVGRGGLFLCIGVFLQDGEISGAFSRLCAVKSLRELLVADLCLCGRGFSNTWHFFLGL